MLLFFRLKLYRILNNSFQFLSFYLESNQSIHLLTQTFNLSIIFFHFSPVKLVKFIKLIIKPSKKLLLSFPSFLDNLPKYFQYKVDQKISRSLFDCRTATNQHLQISSSCFATVLQWKQPIEICRGCFAAVL